MVGAVTEATGVPSALDNVVTLEVMLATLSATLVAVLSGWMISTVASVTELSLRLRSKRPAGTVAGSIE